MPSIRRSSRSGLTLIQLLLGVAVVVVIGGIIVSQSPDRGVTAAPPTVTVRVTQSASVTGRLWKTGWFSSTQTPDAGTVQFRMGNTGIATIREGNPFDVAVTTASPAATATVVGVGLGTATLVVNRMDAGRPVSTTMVTVKVVE